MSSGWSDADKAVVHEVARRARAGARAETLSLFRAFPVKNVEDLWELEIKLREWRRERGGSFTPYFEKAEEQISEWLARRWIDFQDVASLSEARLERLRARTGIKK